MKLLKYFKHVCPDWKIHLIALLPSAVGLGIIALMNLLISCFGGFLFIVAVSLFISSVYWVISYSSHSGVRYKTQELIKGYKEFDA